ncbi:MAG: PD-(D/E)XK nuclease family protein [Bacteroidales bacterium]|nr:PD-(D/E)XK nuclease family protein [Bacteroidales bacterium]
MNAFINILAEHIKSHYDLQHEELTVVFPNKRAAFYLRDRFAKIFQGNIWIPQMLSIEEAVTQWSGIQLADTVDLMFELIAIDAEIEGHSNGIAVFGSMASQMAKDFDEVDQYAVDAKHLFSYIYEEKKIGLWNLGEGITPKEQAHLDFFKKLQVYYERLRNRLSEQGKGYYGMITRTLSELSDNELRKKTGNRRILFAGFNALTPTEQKIIDKLYRNGQAEVVWDFDRYYVEDKMNEAGLFARRYLEQDVPWKPTVFSDALLNDEKEIHFVGVTGNTVQAKALQSLLQVEQDTNSAVILADEELLIPVLNAIPENGSFPSVKVSMGYPLRHTALNELISEFFILHRKGRKVNNQGWYLWPVLRILDLEMVKVVFNKQELGGIQQYQDFVKDRSAFIFTEKDFEEHCRFEDVQQFMRLLLGTVGSMTPSELLASLTALLTFIAQRLNADSTGNLFLLNQVSEAGKAVNRLKNILDRSQRYLQSLDELEILYRLVNSNVAVKLNSSTTKGLQLMGLLEARNLDFDTMYMVGVNEGILPAERSHGSFIPYNIRKECGLPDYQEKQAVYAYHFYRQLQRARRIFFLYNDSSADQKGEPSRFLMQLQHELTLRNPHVHLYKEHFLNKTPNIPSPEAIAAKKTPEVMEKLMRKIQTDKLNEALAPTSLSTFLQCPLKFFLKYMERLQDNRVEEETQVNEIGTIIHDTLELFYRPFLNTEITADRFKQEIRPSLPQHLQAVIHKLFEQGLPNVGYNYLNQRSISRMLNHYLQFEEANVREHTLAITEVEHTLHTTIMVNGVNCVISGKADRIDKQDGVIRIIDYKTGKVEDKDVIVPKEVAKLEDIPEKALQLLIYKYLYLKEHSEVMPEQVSAALFCLRKKQVVFELRIDDQSLTQQFMETMEGYLEDILTRLMDPTVPFGQTEDPQASPCRLCDFKELCVNSATIAQRAGDR